jgi:hypothetical protein
VEKKKKKMSKCFHCGKEFPRGKGTVANPLPFEVEYCSKRCEKKHKKMYGEPTNLGAPIVAVGAVGAAIITGVVGHEVGYNSGVDDGVKKERKRVVDGLIKILAQSGIEMTRKNQ